jgi:hypothetical protein
MTSLEVKTKNKMLRHFLELLLLKKRLFFLEHVIDLGIRVRFLFIFLGPKRDNIDYYQIARCMGTLMANKVDKKKFIIKN